MTTTQEFSLGADVVATFGLDERGWFLMSWKHLGVRSGGAVVIQQMPEIKPPWRERRFPTIEAATDFAREALRRATEG